MGGAKQNHGGQDKNPKRKRAQGKATPETSSQTRPFKKSKSSTNPTDEKQLGSSNPSTISEAVLTGVSPSNITTSTNDLSTLYDTTSMSIISASHIQQKVSRALEILSEYPTRPLGKPKLVLLHAKAPVASKMITIAEIAKREIAKDGGKWFQYNKVEEVMVEQKEVPKKNSGGVGDKEKDNMNTEEGEDEETTAFETMKTPFERANEGKPKVRAVPVMTLYLSRVRIDILRKAHGEQTNGLENT